MFENAIELELPDWLVARWEGLIAKWSWLVAHRPDRLTLLFGLISGLGLVSSLGGWYYLWSTTNAFPPAATAAQSSQTADSLIADPSLSSLTVDVTGAVANPGLYSLTGEERVGNALDKAGGLLPTADYSYVAKNLNLATRLKDEDKIYVPFAFTQQTLDEQLNEAGQGKDSSLLTGQDVNPTLAENTQFTQETLLSINTATSKQLETLPSVGEKRAQDIIAGRPYAAITDLIDKKIVTSTIFEEIKSLIKL